MVRSGLLLWSGTRIEGAHFEVQNRIGVDERSNHPRRIVLQEESKQVLSFVVVVVYASTYQQNLTQFPEAELMPVRVPAQATWSPRSDGLGAKEKVSATAVAGKLRNVRKVSESKRFFTG